MGMKGPVLTTSSVDEFATIINGEYFAAKKFNLSQAYGQAKYVGVNLCQEYTNQCKPKEYSAPCILRIF